MYKNEHDFLNRIQAHKYHLYDYDALGFEGYTVWNMAGDDLDKNKI